MRIACQRVARCIGTAQRRKAFGTVSPPVKELAMRGSGNHGADHPKAGAFGIFATFRAHLLRRLRCMVSRIQLGESMWIRQGLLVQPLQPLQPLQTSLADLRNNQAMKLHHNDSACAGRRPRDIPSGLGLNRRVAAA